jgi:molecular chaperone Hsp33
MEACQLAQTSTRLEVAALLSTETCRTAQSLHGLQVTSAIALGRLLTSAGLLAVSSKREGKTSLQILSKARIGQVFADATHDGTVRGLIENPSLAFPNSPDETASGRRTLAPGLLPGHVSAVRRSAGGEYIQSMTPLVLGEVDRDVEYFLEQSDQVPTVLVADCLVDGTGQVTRAGGVLVQALPDGDREHLRQIRERLVTGGFVPALQEAPDPKALLQAVDPDLHWIDAPVPFRWHCPCSFERAKNAVRLMGAGDISEMLLEGKTVTVDCDFCTSRYEIGLKDLEELLVETTTARG